MFDFLKRRIPIQLRVMVLDGLPTIWGWYGEQRVNKMTWFKHFRGNCLDNRARVKELKESISKCESELKNHDAACMKLKTDLEWLTQALSICEINKESGHEVSNKREY